MQALNKAIMVLFRYMRVAHREVKVQTKINSILILKDPMKIVLKLVKIGGLINKLVRKSRIVK